MLKLLVHSPLLIPFIRRLLISIALMSILAFNAYGPQAQAKTNWHPIPKGTELTEGINFTLYYHPASIKSSPKNNNWLEVQALLQVDEAEIERLTKNYKPEELTREFYHTTVDPRQYSVVLSYTINCAKSELSLDKVLAYNERYAEGKQIGSNITSLDFSAPRPRSFEKALLEFVCMPE